MINFINSYGMASKHADSRLLKFKDLVGEMDFEGTSDTFIHYNFVLQIAKMNIIIIETGNTELLK